MAPPQQSSPDVLPGTELLRDAPEKVHVLFGGFRASGSMVPFRSYKGSRRRRMEDLAFRMKLRKIRITSTTLILTMA